MLSRNYLFSTLILASCASIVGIEDLHEEPRPNSGGAAGSSGHGGGGNGNGNGGTASGGRASGGASGQSTQGGNQARGGAGTSGASTTGGTAGEGTGGTTGGSTTTGGIGMGGGDGGTMDGGVGGGGAGGEGGTVEGGAGGGGNPDTSVHGTLIDVYGHKVANAPVSIGATTVLTDAQGTFTIPDVPATYDIFAVVSPPIGGGHGSYGWVYQGLTRRDPTLQVYRGVGDRSSDAHTTLTNGVFTSGSKTVTAFGSPDGGSSAELSSAEITRLSGLSWFGPATTTGRVHTLRWTEDSNEIPTAYNAYVEQSVTATADGTTEVPIALPASSTITTGIIAGTVTSPTETFRRTFAYAHFTSNAAIELVEDWNSKGTFSYLVPSLANSVISVVATEGDDFRGEPFGLVHKDVTPGTSGIALTIPTPAVPTAPAAGATGVGANTVFTWAGNGKVFLFHASDNDLYQGLFVVTAKKQITLPTFPANGFTLRPGGAAHLWTVEVHGNWQSVDQAAGSNGFIDPYAFHSPEPVGKLRGDGQYSISQARGFTTQ